MFDESIILFVSLFIIFHTYDIQDDDWGEY